MSILDLIPGGRIGQLIAAGVLAAAVIGGVTYAVHSYNDGLRAEGRAEIQAKWDADREQWRAALTKQKAEAVMQLAAETKKAIEAEQRLNEFRNTQEQTDATHKATVSGLRDQLSRVRLRDPYAEAARCGSGSGSTASAPPAAAVAGAASGAEASGLLSERTSENLRQLVFSADEVNNAYASCRAAAMNDRK